MAARANGLGVRFCVNDVRTIRRGDGDLRDSSRIKRLENPDGIGDDGGRVAYGDEFVCRVDFFLCPRFGFVAGAGIDVWCAFHLRGAVIREAVFTREIVNFVSPHHRRRSHYDIDNLSGQCVFATHRWIFLVNDRRVLADCHAAAAAAR